MGLMERKHTILNHKRKETYIQTWRVLVANSTPIVDLESRQNSLRVNLERMFDFPTPESPINTILNK